MKELNIRKLSDDVSEQCNMRDNVMGSLGNNNIRGCHIGYFEEKLIDDKEFQNSALPSCPNFYAWLIIFSEHIFWLIREFCFHQQNLRAPTNFNADYNKLLRIFVDKCTHLSCYSSQDIENIFEEIVTVLTIRHSHTHGGFPNTLPATLEYLKKLERPTLNKADINNNYSISEVKNVINFHSNPMNFYKIKERFTSIITFLGKAGPISIGV